MTEIQRYVDKYCFTSEENRRFARSNFTKLVHTNARFEGVNTTLPQTQTIMDGMSVAGVPVEEFFEPPLIDEQQEQVFLQEILTDSQKTTTDKALTVMYHNMRQQIFWDGNKRTATLSANKIMIDGGAGLINVPLDKWDKWNELIADYYRTNDMTKIKQWTYDNAIQGLEVRVNKDLGCN